MGFKKDRVTVVPPGIDEKFRPGGTKTSHPSVVAVGRLVPVKDFPRLIRIMASIRDRVPTATLTIVGDGYEREAIEALIAELGADHVTLAGRISDNELISLYQSAWVVASTSVREGWGMTLTEAAACGTPAVATRIAGHLDATVEGSSGLLHDRDEDLADALTAVLTDEQLRAKLTAGALQRASELTWEATALGTFTVLAADAARRESRRGVR
jgi:glycosyltransferase involved in cell wall biosynthesis